MNKKIFDDIIIKEYTINMLSTVDIAKKYNCHKTTIQYRLKKNNIEMRGTKGYNPKKHGIIFGKLKVISQKKINNKFVWKCKCDCGNTCYAKGYQLTDGTKKSCGCLIKTNIKNHHHGWMGCKNISGTIFSRIKHGAESRNIKFDISIEDLNKLFEKQNKKCALTGLDIFFGKLTRDDNTASLDRIDSSKSYTIDNVQWVHKDVNKMKQSLQQDYFIEMCKKIANFN